MSVMLKIVCDRYLILHLFVNREEKKHPFNESTILQAVSPTAKKY